MLFSGGSAGTKGTPPKESKKERKPDKDEKYEIKEAVFLRWANSIIDGDLQDLREIADVKYLSKFATLILGVPVALSGKNEADDIDAIFHAMVPDDPDDRLFQISVNDLLSGNQKALLTMCWQLIQIFWEKFAPAPSNERKMVEALKEWCLDATASYPDVIINDFTSSFRDGMAINILIKSFDDSLIDLSEISELRGEDRIENALSLARRHFRVPKLIQPKEFYSEHLDMKSVSCYLMMLYLGMCESSTRPQRIPSTRRRSTLATTTVGNESTSAPSTPSQPQQTNITQTAITTTALASEITAEAVTSFPEATIHSQMQQQQILSGLPVARHSIAQAIVQIPVIYAQQQNLVQSAHLTDSSNSVASAPPYTGGNSLQRIIQANMLTPPSNSQSSKAFIPLLQTAPSTTTTAVISPLAQQSHNQAQLLEHQKQIESLQQKEQQQPLFQPPTVQIQSTSQLPMILMQQQTTSHNYRPLQLLPPLPQVIPSNQPLPSLNNSPNREFNQQLSPKSLAQFTLPPQQSIAISDISMETGMRSRKSSSCSSSRTSRSRRKPEELLQEYGDYLQQVLTWLNEAEQELELMSPTQKDENEIPSLEIAKEKFHEHEKYMQSLTQSQESVGRVLHRGHHLSKKLEDPEESTTIINQLQSVQSRWELIRTGAMERQTALQQQIEKIQKAHLNELIEWLEGIERRSRQQLCPLAENVDVCLKQRVEAGALKRQMDEKQPAFAQLSSFVEVVEQISQQKQISNVQNLEILVKQVDKRWNKLLELISLHIKLLEGLGDLLEKYEQLNNEIFEWLNEKTNKLNKLKTPNELNTEEEVQNYLESLRSMEKALENQKELFEHFSNICNELANRFEKGKNLSASQNVLAKLYEINNKRDGILKILEENSEMLIQSGKVKLQTSELPITSMEDEEQPRRKITLETIYSVDESRRGSESPQSAAKKRKLLQLPPAEHLTIEETEEGPMKKEFRFEEEKIKEMRELKGDDEINPIKEQQLSPTSKQTEEEKTSTLLNQFVQKVTSLNQKLQPLIEWTKSEFVQQQMPSQQEKESSTYKKPQNIRQAVLNCQKRLNEIREMEPAVTKLQIQLEFLHNRVKLSSKQLHEVNEIFDEFMSCWSRVVGAISKVLSNLSRPEPLIKSPSKTPERQQKHSTNPNKIFLMIEQLDQWLIASSKYLDELPQQMPTNDKFDKIAKIAKQLGEQQAHLSHLKRLTKLTPEETKALLELEKRMISLLNRIDKLTDATEEEEEESKLKIEEKIRPQIGSRLSPRTTTVQLKQDTLEDEQHLIPSTSIQKSTSPPLPLDEAETLRMKLLAEEEDLNIRANLGQEKEEDEWSKWLREKEKELNLNEECIPGDLKSLSAQLEKCDEMIAELRNKRCAASSSESDVEMVGPIEGLLRAAETKRNHCVDSINKTQLAIHKAVKLEEIGDQFKRELEWLRKNLSVDESSLRESFERIKYLKNSLQLQEETKKEALNLLEEVAQIALNNTKNKIGNISGEQMRERINKLKNQWKMLENEIEELLDCCNRESQRRAKSWLNSLKLILEELEQALKGSFESATDAEELSEHLDNLERLLDRLGSIEREAEEEGYRLEITEYHPQLIELTKQRESLIQATYERCTQLRNAVAHCEHFEQRLCQMHNWGTNMQQILNQRLASDTYSLEVPNEYKDSQRTGTLFKKMDKEFSEYDKLVAELDEYIRQSKSEFASTERLKLQLDHANQQLSLLRPKFAKFKQPIGLFERMDRIQQQLAEIESSMDDLAGIEAENCEFCLLHLEQIQHQLEELSTDCSACEASRDTLIREGIIEEKQALKLSAQLSEMTTKCVDELENRATTNIQRLKRAVDFVEKLDRESAVLDKLLGEIENRLQSDDYKNEKPVQRSLKIIDELYRQLRATTDSTAKAKELESSLRNLAIRITKEKIECIKNAEQRCSKLRDKLDEWNELINEQMIKIPTKKEIEKQNPLNEQIKLPEGIFNEINELAKELDKRFGQLEKQNQMPSFQLNERLNSLRPLKERFEYLSLQTVSRKDFGSKVAPLLANLSSRWQNLTKNALDRKRQEEQIKYQENLQLLQEQQCTSPLSFGEISPTTAYEGGLSESLEDVRDFGQQVQSTIEHFERAKRHLNYSRHPVNSLHDWEQRLTKIGQYVANRKLNFDVLIAGGKHIAESGPMELLTSAALSKLDELIDLVHNVDEQVEREEQRLHNICQQFGVFNGQIQMAKERLEAMEMKADALNTRAIDPTPIIVSFLIFY
uniref:Calponin-homology (CH) domain-containing protein n=2 Tax=Meloidogyne hapla TaxID=6305 RepID=A0A1I8B635_MELHA